ncbi:MAG TPA: creatininase family protein [Thermoleophilaceae bacterium]|nr:creatininase family protein [Thermoleophilaceae bacterium]
MPAVELDKLSWPEVEAELHRGRDTVVVAFGATEQHARHLPLATDALIGDHLARLVADRLDAFVARTVRVGCSAHHLDFPGTLSLEEETFHAVVADLVRSLARAGFRRLVLVPTHGGNFAPLATALEELGELPGTTVVALTDLGVLLEIARTGEREHGVPLSDGGLHAGEWETSMLLYIHPELVHMERAEAGYTGDLQQGIGRMFESGVKALSENGAIGDPSQASAEHGERYLEVALELVLEQIEAAG